MRSPKPFSWEILALQAATLATLSLSVVSLRSDFMQSNNRVARYGLFVGRACERLASFANDIASDSDRILKVSVHPESATVAPATSVGSNESAGDVSTNSAVALKALLAARKATAKSPREALAHFNLAVALERLGFWSQARVELETAAILESDPARTAKARGWAREFRRSDPSAALIAAMAYIAATNSPKSRELLNEYLETPERTGDGSQWNLVGMNLRLERAAKLYANGVSSPELLPHVLAEAATALTPRDRMNLYMERYLLAGGLHRARRTREAVAVLHSLDADIFRARGRAGWKAQTVCEEAIDLIIRRSSDQALYILRTAFRESTSEGDPRLAALYASLAGQVRTHLLRSGLPEREIATIGARTSCCRHKTGEARKERLKRHPTTSSSRMVKYGALIASLQFSSDAGFNGAGVDQATKRRGEMRRALSSNAAMIEYVIIRDYVIAFVIRRNDVEAVPLFASAADVKNAADAMRHADDDRFATAAGRLYDLILDPIAARLEGLSVVAFVPHADLAGIPFGALFDVQRGQFLIERVTVVHARSTSAAIDASRALKQVQAPTLLTIAATDFDRERYPQAAPLPGAQREVDSITALSPCARRLVGPAATPEAIQRQLVENAVIHYAGHIVRRGAETWLPLMPFAGRYGLSTAEIAGLRMENARVVVLSACRGALPNVEDDLLPTMVDAFLNAGAPAVIASSYDVDDSDAPATMRRLHVYLRDGADPAEALRKTTNDELRRGVSVPLSLRFMATGGAVSLIN